MPRLTTKAISDTIKTLTEDIKLRFHLHHEQIMALRHDRDYMRKDLSDVSYCLAQQLTINDLHSERIDALSQLAQQQAETIRLLTDKVSELAEELNQLGETVTNLADEEALSHQWLDRQQSRIVALEGSIKDLRREIRDGDYATLEEVAQLRNKVTSHEPQAVAEAIRNAHNATMRMDIHSKWIGQLFDRLNESVKE